MADIVFRRMTDKRGMPEAFHSSAEGWTSLRYDAADKAVSVTQRRGACIVELLYPPDFARAIAAELILIADAADAAKAKEAA